MLTEISAYPSNLLTRVGNWLKPVAQNEAIELPKITPQPTREELQVAKTRAIVQELQQEPPAQNTFGKLKAITEECTILHADIFCVVRSGGMTILSNKQFKFLGALVSKVDRIVGSFVGAVGLIFVKSTSREIVKSIKENDEEKTVLSCINIVADSTLTAAGIFWAIAGAGELINISKRVIDKVGGWIDRTFAISSLTYAISSLFQIVILKQFQYKLSDALKTDEDVEKFVTYVKGEVLVSKEHEDAVVNGIQEGDNRQAKAEEILSKEQRVILKRLERRCSKEVYEIFLNDNLSVSQKRELIEKLLIDNIAKVNSHYMRFASSIASAAVCIASMMNPTSALVYFGFTMTGLMTLALDWGDNQMIKGYVAPKETLKIKEA